MLELLGVLIIVLAVFVLRRLLGIERGRWASTLVAVLLGEAAAALIIRKIYGSLSGAPIGAVFGAWALVIVFAMLILVLIELLAGPIARPGRAGLPHPVRALRFTAKRVVRYAQVGRVVIHRGLLRHGADPAEVASSRLGRTLRMAFEDAGGLFREAGAGDGPAAATRYPGRRRRAGRPAGAGRSSRSRGGPSRDRRRPGRPGPGVRRDLLDPAGGGLDRPDLPGAPARRPRGCGEGATARGSRVDPLRPGHPAAASRPAGAADRLGRPAQAERAGRRVDGQLKVLRLTSDTSLAAAFDANRDLAGGARASA